MDKADIARRNKRRGSQVQSKIAKSLNGRNIGASGGTDVITNIAGTNVDIEVKCREKFVGLNWLQQAESNAKSGTLPLVLIHINNTKYVEDMVLLRLSDLKNILGGKNEKTV